MNKRELKEQLQDNLLTYFDDRLEPWILDKMCQVIIKTIDEHE